MPDDVECWLAAWPHDGDGYEYDLLTARLAYNQRDPYQVDIHFPLHHPPTTWIFARDLLVDGLTRHCGQGYVQVWPWRTRRGDMLAIILGRGAAAVTLEVLRAPVEQFLIKTYDLVPPGRESQHLDIDAGLRRLLGVN